MNNHAYYSITTRQFTLRCGHSDWLEQTQKLYNEVILFYYQLSLDLEQQGIKISVLNSQQAMRRLEQLTIVGREKNPVPYPLPWKKLPLYFRRAAINGAVTAMHGYLNNETASNSSKKFHCAVTFYKGAYRELTKDSIQLKVWTGKQWTWLHCRLSGNFIPESAISMSPSLILCGKKSYLNVPIKETVLDGRKTKERIVQKANICSMQFTNRDSLAIGVVLNHHGESVYTRFFRGGAKYSHLCKIELKKIESSEIKLGLSKQRENKNNIVEESNSNLMDFNLPHNKKYWMKLKHLSEYYSQTISKQIITFCVAQEAKIIILPVYNKTYTKNVMLGTGNWSPMHLSIKIRKQLYYKAWKAGIIVLEVNAYGCGSVCSVCGSTLRRKKDKFICQNGHQGDYHLNAAKNLGNRCLKSFCLSE